MPKPENIDELRDGLLDAYEWVKADPRRANQVKEMVNAAGKVIGTVKLQLEYAMLRREKPVIAFLGGNWTTETQQLSAQVRKEISDKKPKEA
jgi:uroporphyrinogen-III decarboxylase